MAGREGGREKDEGLKPTRLCGHAAVEDNFHKFPLRLPVGLVCLEQVEVKCHSGTD